MKLFIIAIISLIFLSACQTKEVIKTHGISYLDKREKLIVLNKSNKNDVVNVLGHPATKGMTDENLWIYIERTQTRGKLTKMGRNYLKKNNVLVISFDTYGIVNKKEFYDKNNMKKIEFAKAETVNDIKSENFIYSFLSSIRQKMETKKK
tara:strand:+ start:4365 stop:4814 length:450 start_codon:yes stop_codon:yes gene_type:complete